MLYNVYIPFCTGSVTSLSVQAMTVLFKQRHSFAHILTTEAVLGSHTAFIGEERVSYCPDSAEIRFRVQSVPNIKLDV